MSAAISPKIMQQLAEGMVKDGLLTPDQLAVARVSHEDLGEDLGQILIKKGFVSKSQILGCLGKYLSIPFVSLKKYSVDTKVARKIPVHLARRHHVVPIRRDGVDVVVAMADPLDLFAVEDIRQILKSEIRPVLASAEDIEEIIQRIYRTSKSNADVSLESSLKNISSEDEFVHPEEGKRLEEIATGPKVVQAVNEIIVRAYQEGASDIHIEPRHNELHVRYRIDGILEEKSRFIREMHLPIVSRVKILSGLDIAERRVPQDGRVRIKVGGKPIDLRISTYPTIHGEKVVMRILASSSRITIEDLGFADKERRIFSDLISLPHGIFLVTGPTGSGKSTTLYAALERLNSPDKNIVSIEDPVEREITGVSQAQINSKAGINFASALRAILRQDPDIIMLGEIRDKETAEIAVRAAITGHMVLSTLHTNTTAGAISRLMDLGVEPFLLSSALVGVLAQRLVRTICENCRVEEKVVPESLEASVRGRIKKIFRGRGCSKCRQSGYAGRMGIFELSPVKGEVLSLVSEGAAEAKIESAIKKFGVRSMLEDGIDKVNRGITTIDEVMRVTKED